MAARARRLVRGEFHGRHHAHAADVDHARHVTQRVDAVQEVAGQLRGAADQVFLLEDVHHREAGRARRGVRRVRVAVEELDALGRAGLGDRVVDLLLRRDGAQRLRAVGDRLGHRHQVRGHAERLRAEVGAHPAPAGDDLVEYQQDAVLVADLADAVQVALGRRQAAERAGRRLDEHRRDVVAADQCADPLQVLGEVGALVGLAAHERVLGQRGVPHEVHAGQADAERAPVVDHARQRHAAHVDPVVGALARHEQLPMALAADAVIRQRHLHRRVDRFRAGAGEEHAVQARGRVLRHPLGELERLGMGTRERHRVVERRELLEDRLGDLGPAVPGSHAEEPRRRVDHPVAVGLPQVDALALDEHPGFLFELLVRRERHPEVLPGLCFEDRIGVAHGVVSCVGGAPGHQNPPRYASRLA